MEDENGRIAFLLARDGFAATRAWVERTCDIYRNVLRSPASHASAPEYRALFEAAVRDFGRWLAEHPAASKASAGPRVG